jgi:hypothetical protein
MKNSSTNSEPTRGGGRNAKKSAVSIAIVVGIVLYAFLQPRLNDRWGWELPGIGGPSGEDVVLADGQDSDSPSSRPSRDVDEGDRRFDASRDRNAEPDTPSTSSATRTEPASELKQDTDADLRYGLLREIRRDRFLSPQGLQYVPGSAEGHRLEHLRRHTRDQPSRPGKHGVFDGGMEGALMTIDKAYERAKNKQRTTKEISRERTIYTVDMGRRVGYVGGRDGKRLGNPMARQVKLVLDGTQVITAFPL